MNNSNNNSITKTTVTGTNETQFIKIFHKHFQKCQNCLKNTYTNEQQQNDQQQQQQHDLNINNLFHFDFKQISPFLNFEFP